MLSSITCPCGLKGPNSIEAVCLLIILWLLVLLLNTVIQMAYKLGIWIVCEVYLEIPLKKQSLKYLQSPNYPPLSHLPAKLHIEALA